MSVKIVLENWRRWTGNTWFLLIVSVFRRDQKGEEQGTNRNQTFSFFFGTASSFTRVDTAMDTTFVILLVRLKWQSSLTNPSVRVRPQYQRSDDVVILVKQRIWERLRLRLRDRRTRTLLQLDQIIDWNNFQILYHLQGRAFYNSSEGDIGEVTDTSCLEG